MEIFHKPLAIIFLERTDLPKFCCRAGVSHPQLPRPVNLCTLFIVNSLFLSLRGKMLFVTSYLESAAFLLPEASIPSSFDKRKY